MRKIAPVLTIGLLAMVVMMPTAWANGRGPGHEPGPGPGPGPEAGPEAEEGPQARECSVLSLLWELPLENLSTQERADLAFMREEEKLARDTYLSMYEAWDLKVFRKIAKAEKQHIAAVLALFDKYGLPDSAAANAIGVFNDVGLQSLYGDLVELGSLSKIDALTVGALVEEMDIYDLITRALLNTNNEDLKTLYQNLAKGSRNHLRAFDKLLEKRGVTYEPDYLSSQTYEEIVSSPIEKGMVDADGEWICGGSKKGNFS